MWIRLYLKNVALFGLFRAILFLLLVSYENSHFRFRQTLQGSGRYLFIFYFIFLCLNFCFCRTATTLAAIGRRHTKAFRFPRGADDAFAIAQKEKTGPPCLSQMFSIIERFSADFFQSAKKILKRIPPLRQGCPSNQPKHFRNIFWWRSIVYVFVSE